jgi:hypothetical protein
MMGPIRHPGMFAKANLSCGGSLAGIAKVNRPAAFNDSGLRHAGMTEDQP